jgi:hydrogenase small subunit
MTAEVHTSQAGGPAVELTSRPAVGAGPLQKVYAFWLAGMSCDGCTISVSGASEPSLEDLLLGNVPGLPRLILYHPVLAVEAGEEFVRNYELAAEGKLDAPYVIILEGSAVDDSLIAGEGYWVGLGARPGHEDGRQVISVMEWVDRMAPGAAAAVAIGTCATWGGIPAAAGNPTGAMGLMDYLGKDYRSAFGLPVVNIPGCAPVGDNFTEVVAMLLHFLQGTGPLPEFDDLGRPAWQFHHTVHNRCVRGGYYEEGVFAKRYGEPECLVELGCWGPVVQCNIVERGAIRHHGGCMNQGGICIGCTMPGFPDKFSPFYKRPPGSAVSTATSATFGKIIRFLRRITRQHQNRETHWDKVQDVPSGWALQHDTEPLFDRLVDYCYRKVQFSDAVRPGRTIPETRYRDDFEVAPKKQQDASGTKRQEGEMKWGYARRRAKLEREAARKKGGV